MAKPKKNLPADEKVGLKFEMPASLHAELIQQSEKSGIKISPYLRKAAELFIKNPIKALEIVSREDDK